jgi:serine/threonine protein kinase
MRHPATLPLLGCRLPGELVVPLCRNGTFGDLLERLFTKHESVPEWTATRLSKCAVGMAASLLYVHSRGLVHGDVRPANFLLDDDCAPLLFDFGQSRRLTAAPESVACDGCTNKVDVYSYGATLYQLFAHPIRLDSGRWLPKGASAPAREVQRGGRFVYDESIPPFYWDLIRACLAEDPAHRPSFAQIVGLLRSDPRSVLDGTDDSALSAYEAKVLPAEFRPVRRFVLGNPSTAACGHRCTMADVGRLADKVIDGNDFKP